VRTWQPRVITTPPRAVSVAPGAVPRLDGRRVAQVAWRQRGFVLRSALRLGLGLIALTALPLLPALLVVAVLAAAQVLCDEPAPPPASKNPALKSI
jgi:hypothetical protein